MKREEKKTVSSLFTAALRIQDFSFVPFSKFRGDAVPSLFPLYMKRFPAPSKVTERAIQWHQWTEKNAFMFRTLSRVGFRYPRRINSFFLILSRNPGTSELSSQAQSHPKKLHPCALTKPVAFFTPGRYMKERKKPVCTSAQYLSLSKSV